MSRREDLNRHHTIRRTYAEPPRRRISVLLLVMIIAVASMGTNALNTARKTNNSSSTAVPGQPGEEAPTREQLFEAASTVAGGQWGPELMDNCILMAKGLSANGDTEGASYALMLANGDEPTSDTHKLIKAIAADSEQEEIYRLALTVSHQNSLLVKRSK